MPDGDRHQSHSRPDLLGELYMRGGAGSMYLSWWYGLEPQRSFPITRQMMLPLLPLVSTQHHRQVELLGRNCLSDSSSQCSPSTHYVVGPRPSLGIQRSKTEALLPKAHRLVGTFN